MIECKICKIHSHFQPVEGALYENWIVRPAEVEKNCPGYYYIEARGHSTSYGELTLEAWIEYGRILHNLTEEITFKFNPLKIYTVSIAEAVPHLHFHFVPRYKSTPIGLEYVALALKGELPL